MLVTPFRTLTPTVWDGVEAELDEAPLVSAILGEPPACDAPPPPWDGATHTMLVVSVTEPPADEPEWLTLDPWSLEAVHEYDARYA